MWFKHRAWIPIAWLLSLGNIVATWFAALPAEPTHATIHAALAVLFGLGAQRLAARHARGDGAELPANLNIREELAALHEGQAEILRRVEQTADSVAVELERVGEGQRFLTKVMAKKESDA